MPGDAFPNVATTLTTDKGRVCVSKTHTARFTTLYQDRGHIGHTRQSTATLASTVNPILSDFVYPPLKGYPSLSGGLGKTRMEHPPFELDSNLREAIIER